MKKLLFYSILCTISTLPLHGMKKETFTIVLDNSIGTGEDLFCYVGHPNYEEDQSVEIPAGCCATIPVAYTAEESQRPFSIYLQTPDSPASKTSVKTQAARRGTTDKVALAAYMQTCKAVHFQMQLGRMIIISQKKRNDRRLPEGKTLVCTFGKHQASQDDSDHFLVSLATVRWDQGILLHSQLHHGYTKNLDTKDKFAALKMRQEKGEELEANLPPSEQ
jgi:hypothetical protein